MDDRETFAVWGCYPHEGCWIVSWHATREEAQAAAKQIAAGEAYEAYVTTVWDVMDG